MRGTYGQSERDECPRQFSQGRDVPTALGSGKTSICRPASEGNARYSTACVVVERRASSVAEGRSLETVLEEREGSCQSCGVLTRQVGISYVEQKDGEKVCDGAVVAQSGTGHRGVGRRAQPRCRLQATRRSAESCDWRSMQGGAHPERVL